MNLAFWRERRPFAPRPILIVPSAPADVTPGEEAVLVAAAQKGDRAAFDALCALHIPLLRGFVARRVSCADMVDDVVQETLVGAWLRIAHFEPHARLKTWLYQIALHKSIDANRARLRKGQHEQASLDEGDGDAFAARSMTPDNNRRTFPAPGDRLEAEERRAAILAALDQIPGGQREVVLLYFYAEMTLPEIAQSVGRNLSTVKYQFYAAHVKIADLLADTPWAAIPAKPMDKNASVPHPSSPVRTLSDKNIAPFERKAGLL